MAQITVVYKDFEEMKAVAREILRADQEHPVQATASEAPAAPPVAIPHAPAALAAPVTVPTAPVSAPAPTSAVTPGAPAAPAAVPTAQPAPTPDPAPAAPVSTPVPATAVPTATVGYSLDDLARAGMSLMDSGRKADLQQLLARFNIVALPALPPEQYGAFATALREMGAQI